MIGSNNSFNELISIADTEHELKLNFTMGSMIGRTTKDFFDPQEAGEELWKRFSATLERF